jgi:hypothetical protein
MILWMDANPPQYSIHRYESIYPGRYYQIKEFKLLGTWKSTQHRTISFSMSIFSYHVVYSIIQQPDKTTSSNMWHNEQLGINKNFKENKLPLHFENMSLAKQEWMSLQHDVAPSHFARKESKIGRVDWWLGLHGHLTWCHETTFCGTPCSKESLTVVNQK